MMLSATVIGQETYGPIEDDLRHGRTAQLAERFTSNIDLAILDVDAVYSRGQAEMVLKRFFTDNRPTEFVIQHQGKAAGDCRYIIGHMRTERSEYRVTYFLRLEDGLAMIKQFRIEEHR